ncbi:SirB2 family protein [Colwelliaceae bacterium BS250]
MLILKNLHMSLAAISVALFCLRFALLMTNANLLKNRWLKVLPHIIDTALFLIGVVMMVKLAVYPGQVDWISEKLIAVVAYIFTGYYTLKLARNNMMRIFGFLGALGWVILVVRIAITKQNFLF